MCSRMIQCLVAAGCLFQLSGCGNLEFFNSSPDLAGQVESKATAVAERVGVSGGYGGMIMDGYFQHAMPALRFGSFNGLADPNGMMTVSIMNNSIQACTAHMDYVVSSLGVNEQTQDVDVPAGEQVIFEVPCAEIMGLGSLEAPGAAACHLANGQAVDNVMTVPGFLGLDYQCEEMFQFMLTPDTGDLDGDGDTEELIMQSGAMLDHMLDGGPVNHMHGPGQGMMGFHMGRR